ncbi:MAG: acylphosphatase [Candidatus Rokubacteria bacterium]|nr:acylphosphatase [Candidatus Rokubacteria bacterium]
MSPSRIAADIFVEGRVQGIGYRNYAHRRAEMLHLSGYVMNLKDGRVRVYAEGPRDVIEDFARHLEKGPPLARIERVAVTWRPATGRFAEFSVRYAEFES